MRNLISLCLILATLFCWQAMAEELTTPLWREYVAQKKAGQETFLPDFSYAGYHRGEKAIEIAVRKEFKVTDYGALPDDDLDDRAGIQRAIDAARENGGGIVFLPAGHYLVNTRMDDIGWLTVNADNIVIKGEGSGKGGTILHQIHPFRGGALNDSNRLHLQNAFLFLGSTQSEKTFSRLSVLASVTADSPRGSCSVRTSGTTSLKTGDFVYLYALNKAIIEGLTKPYDIEPEWKTTTENRAPSVEIHQVKSVTGEVVTFEEPIRYPLRAADGWDLRECKPLRNVGVEDILFMGNAYALYKHHRSDIDDAGWSAIKIKGLADSWVRRCSFVNFGQTIYNSLSINVSLLNLVVDGNKGHHIPRAVYFSTDMLGGYIHDRAGFDHGPSLSWGSVGTVFWRCESMGSIDSHAGRPLASLFDNIKGGPISSSGGLRDYPQHLRDMIVWNFENIAPEPVSYDFWKPKSNNRFVLPVFVGFHGKPAAFRMESVGRMESQGAAVQPQSLYEAQLALRLGRLPDWIEEVRNDDKKMQAQALPDYFDRRTGKRGYVYRETFAITPLLEFLCNTSLEMMNPVPFSFVPAEGSVTGDQVMLRHTLYQMMCTIYSSGVKQGNEISASQTTDDGKVTTVFTLTAGKSAQKINEASEWFAEAKRLAALLNAQLASETVGGRYQLRLMLRSQSSAR